MAAALLAAATTNIPAVGEIAKQQLAQVDSALQAGEADKALALLDSLPSSGAGDAEAYNLRCRVFFTLERWNEAVDACEQSVRLDAQNSNDHMWLGRALGRKASHASFLSAFSLGKRARMEFEEAVRFNSSNAAALADLGEFYRSAPGVVGGGLSEAEKIASRLDAVDAARGHELHGRIAEERNDYGTAEREYKEAIAVSRHPAFRWTTLADFYRRRKRWTEMEGAVQSCISAARRDKQAGVPLFDGASVLIDASRDLPLAAKMLEEYLGGPAKTEEAPAFAAYTRLARIYARLGDETSAKREQAAALALAREYEPATDLSWQETGH
jgi:tetratricopeptide (TPR) repeat protein